MTAQLKYKYADYSIWLCALAAVLTSYFFTWQQAPVNFIDGDARYYYYYLQSTFIDAQLINSSWLNPDNGVIITHHPAGLSLLLLPFFLPAYAVASWLHYPLNGSSVPFQAGISAAAIFYCIIGLVYLKKLCRLNGVSDRVTALVILLVFLGTNLFHYTLSEPAMSHVYSFSLIAVFLYQGCQVVRTGHAKNIYAAAFVLGLILLVRPNNGLIVFSLLFWFGSRAQMHTFFKDLIRQRAFYLSFLLLIAIICIQPLTWLLKEDSLYVNRYAAYGFYWLHPQLMNMLFGFDGGFFIYTPICLLFLLGLVAVYKEHKFLFYGSAIFILLLFYIFASYSAYTYYDGIGIRVLVDYYALFALLGAKLFDQLRTHQFSFAATMAIALFFVFVNQVYCYQADKNILLRSGMTYNKWKYIFLKTGRSYEGCLGGSNDLAPFAKLAPKMAGSRTASAPFNYAQKDFGLLLKFDSLGFVSKRIQLKVNVRRRESFMNASRDALVCAMLENAAEHRKKKYLQFKLNETPATACCADTEYNYTATMEADFKAQDRLSVYVWNIKQQPFFIDKFSVQLYNYNYQ